MGVFDSPRAEVSRTIAKRAVLLLCLWAIGCGATSDPQLVGRWESTAGPAYAVIFRDDGTMGVRGKFVELTKFRFAKPLKVYTDFDLEPGDALDIKYRRVGSGKLEIVGDYSELRAKLSSGKAGPSSGNKSDFQPRETVTYAVNGDQLTLQNEEQAKVTLKRAADSGTK